MSHLADKMKLAAERIKALPASVEAQLDAVLAQQQDLSERTTAAVSGMQSVIDDARAGTVALEEALKGITNE